MAKSSRFLSSTLQNWRTMWLLATVCLLSMLAVTASQAQTFSVLYNFTGGADGGSPTGNLVMDGRGNLYGATDVGGFTGSGCTAMGGGTAGCGTVFRLSRAGSGWIVTLLHTFSGAPDGRNPQRGVVFGPDGSLYGTTYLGGTGPCYNNNGCGTAFRLRPPATACRSVSCPWTENVLYRFQGTADGAEPDGKVALDAHGNIYGTTDSGGEFGYGVIYQLAPSNGNWTQSVLHDEVPGDGEHLSGVTLDAAGNLYGSADQTPGCCGSVWQLAPAGSGWTFNVLRRFMGGPDGGYPDTNILMDAQGNLYGGTYAEDTTVFELTMSNGNWSYTQIRDFGEEQNLTGDLVMDAAGNLYGTTNGDAFSSGVVFKLTRSGSNWTYSELHQFSGSDGAHPNSNVILDASGDLYGTTTDGGQFGNGVAWEITP